MANANWHQVTAQNTLHYKLDKRRNVRHCETTTELVFSGLRPSKEATFTCPLYA